MPKRRAGPGHGSVAWQHDELGPHLPIPSPSPSVSPARTAREDPPLFVKAHTHIATPLHRGPHKCTDLPSPLPLPSTYLPSCAPPSLTTGLNLKAETRRTVSFVESLPAHSNDLHTGFQRASNHARSDHWHRTCYSASYYLGRQRFHGPKWHRYHSQATSHAFVAAAAWGLGLTGSGTEWQPLAASG